MDDGRFDAWTRRRFGVATGGLAAALLALAGVDEGESKKRHKHKKKRQKKCKTGERRCGKACVSGTCCPGTSCGPSCECGRTVEGTSFCFATDVIVLCIQCESSAECEGDNQCVVTDDCAGINDVTAVCLPPCGAVPRRV